MKNAFLLLFVGYFFYNFGKGVAYSYYYLNEEVPKNGVESLCS